MESTMTLLEFQKNIPLIYEATATSGAGGAVHLVGPPGCGKSDVTRACRAILSDHFGEQFGYKEVLVPGMDAPDARGFLVPTKDEHGRAVSKFTYPPVLPLPEYLKEYKRGILLLDEFNQGDPLTQKALASVVNEGRVDEHELPRGKDAGWLVMMASNRIEDRSGVNKAMMHIINRACLIHTSVHVPSWVIGYADPMGLHPLMIAFAKARPGVFASEVPSEPKPFCSFRSYTRAEKLVSITAGKDEHGRPNMVIPVSGVVQTLAAGHVGDGVAAEMYSFFKVVTEIPTLEQILANPHQAKLPKDDRLDAAFAVMQNCIHNATSKNVDKLWTYIERLPLELQTSAAKSMLEKAGGNFLNSTVLGNWIAKHRALVMSTTA